MNRRFLVILALTLLPLGIPSFSQASDNAPGTLLIDGSDQISIPAQQPNATINFHLPANFILGVNDSVDWAVTDNHTFDSQGNKSFPGLDSPTRGGYQNSDGYRYDLQPLGRNAQLVYQSNFTGIFYVTVKATVGPKIFLKSITMNFASSSTRIPLTLSPGNSVDIQVDSPNSGADLQTMIRFKVSWGKSLNSGLRPIWLRSGIVDSHEIDGGHRILTSSCMAFQPDPCYDNTILADASNGQWFNYKLDYQTWSQYKPQFYVGWYLSDGGSGGWWFSKIMDIPTSFPESKPTLAATCEPVRVELASSCSIKLIYKDAIGGTTDGPGMPIHWTLRSATGASTTGSAILESGTALVIPLPKGNQKFELNSSIDGTAVRVLAVAPPFDYSKELALSLSLGLTCPTRITGDSIKCLVSVSGTSPIPIQIPVQIQLLTDSNATWKTNSTTKVSVGSQVQITIPNKLDISGGVGYESIKATTIYAGQAFDSPVTKYTADWVTASSKVQQGKNNSPTTSSSVSSNQKSSDQSYIIVPSLIGLNGRDLQRNARQYYPDFRIFISTDIHAQHSISCQLAGQATVINQLPRAGSRVRKNSTISAYLDC